MGGVADEPEQRLDDAERSAAQLPHREKYLLLVISLMRRFLELHHELIDNVERELDPATAEGSPRSA